MTITPTFNVTREIPSERNDNQIILAAIPSYYYFRVIRYFGFQLVLVEAGEQNAILVEFVLETLEDQSGTASITN